MVIFIGLVLNVVNDVRYMQNMSLICKYVPLNNIPSCVYFACLYFLSAFLLTCNFQDTVHIYGNRQIR